MTCKGGAISVPFSRYRWLSECKKFYLKSKALIGYTGLLGSVDRTGHIGRRLHIALMGRFCIFNKTKP